MTPYRNTQKNYAPPPSNLATPSQAESLIPCIIISYDKALKCFTHFVSGYQMKSAFDTSLQPNVPDWKANIPYSKDSFQRHVYRKPHQHEELKGDTTRYACNKAKQIPAYGGGSRPFTA